ncbi:MAG TPA: hypothetical protein VGR87_00890 [Candidatus Limnocylindria bacterium]|nr:hypothetical protein [Candidatus Limnocylindria bacterium]
MTFTGLAIAYLLICTALGLWRARPGSNVLLCAVLAAAMVCVQLALLLRL